MKKTTVILVILCAFAASSCSTLIDLATRPLANQIEAGIQRSAVDAASAVVDFKENEILAGLSDSLDGLYLGVAVVKTNASAATKNQAQVIYISDGRTDWANYVIKSRQAIKEDIKIGAQVLFLSGWGGNETANADSYRKDFWSVGTVTNTDELFKGFVEVNGDKFGIKLLRIPSSPIK